MSAFVIGLLAESSVRSALLVMFVAVILAVLRIRAASSTHAAWTAVLCTMLLMPALPYAVPVGIPLPWPIAAPQEGRVLAERWQPAINRNVSPEASINFAAQPRIEPHGPLTTIRPMATNRSRGTYSWTLIALCAYVGTVLLLATRLYLGWRCAARIARRARLVDDDRLRDASDLHRICESAAIVTPITVGAIAPVILLPLNWRRWSDEQVRAVIAHECAHVRRRDPLVNLIAQVNRYLFWFHPAAWWLERALATAAEQACDEAAIGAVGAPDTYAQLLIDMARTIRERRGRLAWSGIGISGSGRLGRRIDYVLSGASSPRVSSRRKAAAIICCATATTIAVACRPQLNSPQSVSRATIEQRDWKLRLDLEHVENTRSFTRTLGRPELPPVELLEAANRRSPANLEVLKALLVSYWIQPPADLSRRRALVLWLIEYRPNADLAGSVEARLFPNDLGPLFPGDPVGYEHARTLWLARANAPDAKSQTLGNAAAFFEASEGPLAEQLLVRARAADPSGPWVARLGRLYADVLAGSQVPGPSNRLRQLNAAAPRGAFGMRIRKLLAESNDGELLTAAGWFLLRGVRGPRWLLDFDPDRWAERCFWRALQLNPRAVLARTSLLEVDSRVEWSRGEPLWSAPPAELYDSITSLPEAERFERLPKLAREASQRIEFLARWNDDPLIRDRIELSRQQARRFAADALALAPRYRNHPKYGTAIFLANMTLGTLALRNGDRTAAVLFLRKAARAPASEELAYSKGMASSHQWHLAGELLKLGERDAVLDFLDRMAAISLADGIELREAATEVRRGGTPTLLVP